MKTFITEAVKEFEHVSWPTDAETKKYFSIVVTVITIFAIFLFVISELFGMGLFALKDQIHPAQITPTANTAPVDLSKALQDVKVDAKDIKVDTKTTPVAPKK